MRGVNGIEMAQCIRQTQPDMPIVLTSGYSSVLAQHADQGFELLHTPYSVDQLARILRKTLRSSCGSTAHPGSVTAGATDH